MKTRCTLLIALITGYCTLQAQGPEITNGGFNNWVNGYTPVGWATLDGVVGASLGLSFEDSVDKLEGQASIKLVADSIAIQPARGVVPGLVSLGTGSIVGTTLTFAGAPFTFRPDTLFFSYQYTSPGTDTAALFLNLAKAGSGIIGSTQGFEVDLDTSSEWIGAYVLLTPYYLNSDVPDTLNLQFIASGAQQHVKGSTLHIDAVYFTYATVLEETAASSGSDTICADSSVTLRVPSNPAYTSYQWYQNGNAIANANSANYTATDSGEYYVVLDSAGAPGLSQLITVTLKTNCTSGITDIAPGVYLNVYPNPAPGILNVTSDKDLSGFNIQLFDITGRMLSSQTLDGLTNTVNVSKLSDGTYIYRITDKQNIPVAQNKFNVMR